MKINTLACATVCLAPRYEPGNATESQFLRMMVKDGSKEHKTQHKTQKDIIAR
jgi:hypothetical protein